MSEWTEHKALPPMDGTYEVRMDEDDDEPMIVFVRDRSAYTNDGTRRVFMNFEWRKIST